MHQLELTTEQTARLAPLIARFRRDAERQQQRDAEILASLGRVLSNPRGTARADAGRFTDFVRNIVRQEIAR